MLDFLVLAAGSLLTILSVPSEWLAGGWGFLGPLALLPVFWFTSRRKAGWSAAGGVLWVTLVLVFSQSWLFSFHPAAFPLVWCFQALWYAGIFSLSSLLWRRFPRSGLWFQALLWTFFEYLRVQGFFAYPYGSLASAFWAWPLAFQSADLFGTSGLTFLLAWTSAWAAAVLSRKLPWARLRGDLALGAVLWAGNLGYGAWRLLEPAVGEVWRPALVQQSMDPWRGGASAYEAGFERLEALSIQAMADAPDAVIWSETAFIPSVEFHRRYRESASSLRLVRRLETFLGRQKVPFLVGNDHREKASDGTVLDYNAALVWDGGWKGRYEKNRLVPFTESFPFRDLLPWVYDWLREADTHFWQPGRGRGVLTLGGAVIGTPICYEDAFPDGAREFSLAGARALVNLTNDSWAGGTASRMQHLSLAVFRAVETRLPLLRAGNDGATAAVSSRGEVIAILPVGPPGVLQAEVRLGGPGLTWYTRSGDWFAVSAGIVVIAAILWRRRSPVVDKGPEL